MSKKIKITEIQLKSLLEQLEGDQDQRISKASEPEFKTFDDILNAVGSEAGLDDDDVEHDNDGIEQEDESIEDMPVQESILKIKNDFKRFI
jgi:hypothetical protein